MIDPITLAFPVACSSRHAFEMWTSRIGTWWPADHTVSGRVADLSEMLTTLSHRRLLSGFEATQRFFEIGTPAGIAELNEYLQQQAG